MLLGQAAACRLPVVATTNTGAEDLVIDAVEDFAVTIRSPEAIREKVLYLYENPEVREKMSQAALRCFEAIGGWDANGVSEAAVCANALGQRLCAVREPSPKIVVERSG